MGFRRLETSRIWTAPGARCDPRAPHSHRARQEILEDVNAVAELQECGRRYIQYSAAAWRTAGPHSLLGPQVLPCPSIPLPRAQASFSPTPGARSASTKAPTTRTS